MINGMGSNKSAIKAMVVNRVGDLGLTLGTLATLYTISGVDFATILALAPYTYKLQSTTFFNTEINKVDLIGFLFYK
jgi:NADH:ubiquinone oxidoreductase subunit 5 (subunit L)/multisubunit Na+/H+ antiporter MnhA subunit